MSKKKESKKSEKNKFYVVVHGLAVVTYDEKFFHLYLPNVPGHTVAIGSFGFERQIVPAPGKKAPHLTLDVPGWEPKGDDPDPATDVVIIPKKGKFSPKGHYACKVSLPRTVVERVRTAHRPKGSAIFDPPLKVEPEFITVLPAFGYETEGLAALVDEKNAKTSYYSSGTAGRANLHIWSTQAFVVGLGGGSTGNHSDDEVASINAMFKPRLKLKTSKNEFPDLSSGDSVVPLKEQLTIPEFRQQQIWNLKDMKIGKPHCYAVVVKPK